MGGMRSTRIAVNSRGTDQQDEEAYAELLVGAASPQVSDSLDRSTPDFCISLEVSNMGTEQQVNPTLSGYRSVV
jgi:hypothetical protein